MLVLVLAVIDTRTTAAIAKDATPKITRGVTFAILLANMLNLNALRHELYNRSVDRDGQARLVASAPVAGANIPHPELPI